MLGGRVALVTGGAAGIGRAIVERLAAEGATTVAADVAPGPGGERLDVRDPEAWAALTERIAAEHGRLDILVNNAGIAGRSAPSWELRPEEWREVIDIDLSGVFYGCRACIPHMRRGGHGRIVNIASIAGKEGNPNASPYSAAKAGVIGLTKSIAKEVVADGILVNCVTPAVIETEILRQMSEEHVRYMLGKIPMGRAGQPSEVAALVAWLASEECTFSTGAVFDISGGRATY